jgi:hypothetical protein
MWRWSDEHSAWFSDLNDASWVERCIETARAGFRSIFGRAPEANRFGDRWISEDAVAILRNAGFRYDVTVEPGIPGMPIHDDPHATQWLPDYRDAPRMPYVAMGNNYLIDGGNAKRPTDLWMVPLTTTKVRWRLVRRPPYVMRGSRSPNLSLSHSYVWPHIRAQLDKPSHNPIVVAFRSGDLVSRTFMRNFERTTSELVRHPALAFCELTSVPDAIERWQSIPR